MLKKIKKIKIALSLFVIAKLFFFTNYMVVLWDEAVYIGMGKYLFSSGGVGLFEPIRPLVVPLLLGFLWKINLNVIIFGKILALIFSVAYLFLTYLIAKEVFDNKVALLSSVLLAITPLFFFNSIQIMTGIPSTVFGLLAVLFLVKKKNPFLIGMFCGLAFLTRFPQGILLPALVVSLFFVYKKKEFFVSAVKICLSFFITLLPYLIFNYFTYKNLFYPFILASVHQANPVHKISSYVNNLLYYIIEPIKDNLLFIFLLIGLFFILKKKLWKDHNVTILLTVLLFNLLYFTYMTNKQPRFYLTFLPFFAMIACFGFMELMKKIKTTKSSFRRGTLMKLFLLIAILLVIPTIHKDINLYGWRINEESPIQREFFKYSGFKGASCVLTTDPVPVAYADTLFIPYYDSIFRANQIYDMFEDECDYMIYTPDPFPCEYFGVECQEAKDGLFNKINSTKELLFYNEYYGHEYYIYQ